MVDTGEWFTVYNLRVADHHTYFVGCDDWGFSVWAHNACIETVQIPLINNEEVIHFARAAWEERVKRGLQDGQKDIAYALESGSPSLRGPWLSGSLHSEQNLINGLTALGYPTNSRRVISVYTERSPCGPDQRNCLETLRNWLHPQPGDKVMVYYLVDHLQGQSGDVLIDRYRDLGIV